MRWKFFLLLLVLFLVFPLTAAAQSSASATAEVTLTIEQYGYICGLNNITVCVRPGRTWGWGLDCFFCGANYNAILEAEVQVEPGTPGEWSVYVYPGSIEPLMQNFCWARVYVTGLPPGCGWSTYYVTVTITLTQES